MQKPLVILVFLILIGLPALAGPVLISVGTANPASINPLSVDAFDVLAAAWFLPDTFNSVTISIYFQDLLGGGTFSAFLMDGIGPQADPLLNEMVRTTFGASQDLSMVNLWDNLTLGPGFYYLVIGTTDPNSVGGWGATTSPLVTLRPGVLQGDVSGVQFFASGLDVNTAYLPASTFAIDDLAFGQLMYAVSVPEPSTLVSLLAGGLWLAWLRRRCVA